ncbi:MAG: hypothetical protein WCV92_03425 [Candidatus Buchananbacteria bacterium]
MIITGSVILVIVYLVCAVILLSALWGAWSAAPWVPTFGKDTKRMVDLAQIKKGDIVYDLGSGDGRLVFGAVSRGATGTGIEIFILPWLYSWIKSFFHPGAKMILGDMFKKNISDANVVFIYLLDKSYGRLMKKFEKELKPGTKIIVGCWPIKELESKLIKKDKPTNRDLAMYVYEM